MMGLIFNYVEEYFKKNNVEYSYSDVMELTSYLFGSLVCYNLICNKLKIKEKINEIKNKKMRVKK